MLLFALKNGYQEINCISVSPIYQN